MYERADTDLRHPLFTLTVYLYTLILLPLLHALWLLTGTGNANFFYAGVLVHSLNSCLAVVDVLTASMRYDIKDSAWGPDWVPVQLTSVE
jgi:phosphatidylinositol glycan class U